MAISKIFDKEGGREFLYFVVTIILSSAAYYFSTGVYNCWILTWLAPIPLLVYALRGRSVYTILASFISYFFGLSSGILAYANTIIPISILVYANILDAIVFTIMVVLFRYLVLKEKHWVWSFVFASGWTAFEFSTAQHSPAGAIDSIAYTQVYNLPVGQIASVTGIWGITFLLLLVPASVALAWYYRKNSKLWLRTIVIPLSILMMILIFGGYRLYGQSQGPRVRIGMAAINMTVEDLLSRGQPQESEKIIGRYIDCIDLLSRSGAEVVLLPEKIAVLDLNDQAKQLERLATAARRNQIRLIVGLSVQADSKLYNSAYLFLPSGEIGLRYDKQHLLPYAEGRYTPGEKLGVSEVDGKGVWGIAICKDMDFEEPSRGYGQAGTNLLFVPALDFKADELLRARIAIMRGVEENYAIARAAQWGLLSLSDNKGKIIKMESCATEKDEVLVLGEIQLDQGKSIYSRFGNWFGYFAEGVFGLLMLFFISLRRQTRKRTKLFGM
ncbi:MAG: Nitrilase/cyanide hydratase and apolipoprotein N-acyltransferase [Firmicutes bacterium]|nr:Nitrilase/cyanide hydratase and apolipoprotein N-acyltransferase [Bacillota bacterium]